MFVTLSRALHLCRVHRVPVSEFLATFGEAHTYHATTIADWFGAP